MKRMRLALVVLGSLFLLPFVLPWHRPPQPAFDVEWVAAVALAVLALCLALVPRTQATINWPLPAFFAALLSVAAIQRAMGMLTYNEQLVFLVIFVFAMTAAYLVGRGLLAFGGIEAACLAICWALVVGGVLSVLVQSMQILRLEGLPALVYFEIDSEWHARRPFGNLGQPNLLATYLCWSCLAAMYLSVRGAMGEIVTLALSALFAAGIAVTGSMMGLMLVASLVAAIWLPSALQPRSWRDRAVAASALAGGYLLGSLAVTLLISFQGAPMEIALARTQEGTIGFRVAMWADAWRVSISAPLVGVGFGEFASAQYWIATASPSLVATPYVHNIVLQLAAETGWPIALALVALGLWWAVASIKIRFLSAEKSFVWAAMLVIAVHSLVEWPLWNLNFAIPAALLFALAEPHAGGPVLRFGTQLLPALGIAGLAVAVPMKVEYDELAQAKARIDAERAQRQPHSAESIVAVAALANASLMRPWADRLLLNMMSPADQQGDAFIDLNRRVLSRVAEAPAIARLVILLTRNGQAGDALRHVDRLRVFSGSEFPRYRQVVLNGIQDAGDDANVVRAALADAS